MIDDAYTAADRDASKPLVVLGVDAASHELIHRWAGTGALPAIRGLLDRGLSGTVAGVEGFFIGSTWPSLYTGLYPSSHGFYRIRQLRSGTYTTFRPLDEPGGVAGSPFWRVASEAGRRVAVMDVPLSRLEPDLGGVQTVEWGGHDAVFGFHTSPEALRDEILATAGAYPLPADCDAERRTASDFEAFVSGLEAAVRSRTELTLRVMAKENWDLVVQVFTEAHCAGHQCWHLHDPGHPAHDPALREAVGNPLERVYRAIDAGVAAILEQAPGARVLLFSAHGMGPFRGAHFLLPQILHRLGVTVKPADPARSRPGLTTDLTGAFRRVWGALPEGARTALRPVRRAIGPSDGTGWTNRADLDRSQCFPVPNGFPVAGIRLNLAGREPRGRLSPGAEADAFCDQLTEDLLAIVDERTGGPLIQRVLRTRDLYQGPREEALPDLLVEWSGDIPTGTLAHGDGRGARIRARSDDVGTVDGVNRWGRTGEHVPTGFFVLAGPGLPMGQLDTPVPLVDLHPTICRLLGLPDPAVDGSPVAALLPTTT